MGYIEKILNQLEDCITNNNYKALETEEVEIKDCSNNSDWKELYKSANAFLNTEGGIIIVGIKEDNKKISYKFTGYNENTEPKIKEISMLFKDDSDNQINLGEYFDYKIIDFLDGRICLIFIDKLPDDKKFIFYDGKAYERRITGDHLINKEKIESQKEYKKEIENIKELSIVPSAKLKDIDIDRLNEYITLLNRYTKKVTYKSNIEDSIEFLEKKKFIRNQDPTILGMLVCGKDAPDFLGGRCQVDCFVESKIDVAKNKKVYKNNIIQLMENSIEFVINNIQIGISADKGGTNIPEYPLNLIRESVNNSLAHRSYDIDKYINININPGKYLEIRNPGSFKESLLITISEHESDIPIRRIIANLPKA